MRLAFVVLGVGFSLFGCKAPGTANGDGVDAAMSGGSDSGIPADFQMLISRSWTIDPDVQTYKCVRAQVPSDMWITAFRSLAPIGTHHTVLTISTSSQAGEYDCSAGSVAADNQMLYASGVGTDDNAFPDGVAIHLAAGTYVNLNLHLYNTTDKTITATSGVLVKTVDAASVVHEADMQFSGTYNISVPSDNQVYSVTGHCSVASDFHIFTLWPHMHQIATRQTFTVTPSSGSPATMLDVPYSFSEQKNYPMVDTVVHAGDKLTTTCYYQNNTGATVTFGEGSQDEMCFTGIYRYPAGGNLFACVTGQAI